MTKKTLIIEIDHRAYYSGKGGVLVLGSRDYIKEIGSLRVLHPCAQVHQMIFKDFRAPEVLWKELVVQ